VSFVVYQFPVNLILLEQHELTNAGMVELSDRRAEHIRNVLHAGLGTSIRAGVINGPRGQATIVELSADRVVLRCAFDESAPPAPKVDLLLALPRPKVMRRLWAQLAAMGVGRIILTNASKVERVYFDTHVLQPETYRPLMIEGLQQSQDTQIPEVTIRKQLKILVEDELDILFPYGGRLLADPAAQNRIRDLIFADPGMRVLVAVGPEGGWTDYELDLLNRHGFRPVSMGQRTLRADTACIAVLALVNEALEARHTM
jgi:RsmE family RNA methyltransferase